MSNINPYAPPRAHVADVETEGEEPQLVRTWSAQGRIGRLRYLAHMIAAYLLVLVPGFIAGFLQAMGMQLVGNVLIFATIAVYLWFLVLKSIQRGHDMDWPGWSVIGALIPLAGLVWLFVPGTKGRNRFGAPPPPNTWAVRIVGLFIPILIVGLIAAIAIPAYNDYVKRAKAAQVR